MAAQRQNKKRKLRAREERRRAPQCPNCGQPLRKRLLMCSIPCDIYADQRVATKNARGQAALREALLEERAWNGCEQCGLHKAPRDSAFRNDTVRSLDVHHLSYKRQGKQSEIEDVVLLCRDCHNHVHDHLERHGVQSRERGVPLLGALSIRLP